MYRGSRSILSFHEHSHTRAEEKQREGASIYDSALSFHLKASCESGFFLGGGLWCFAGVFAKNECLIVVFLWWKRGGWVVKRGVSTVSFLGSKNATCFLSLFF